MIRKIIHIDEDKCNGCGLCATACHEGAIDIIDGKAKLVRENFCDGFGDCLPGCPTGAITFEEREAPAYDEAAVQESKKKKKLQEKMKHLHEGGCPGSRMRMLEQPGGGWQQYRRADASGSPAQELAGADQAGPHQRTILQQGKAFDCGGLYCLRIREFSSGIYARQGYFGRLPEA